MRRPRAAAFFDAYTAWHHRRAMAGAGLVAGIFLLNAEFARGTLGATRWHILLLLLVPALGQTLAVFHNPADPVRGRIFIARRILGQQLVREQAAVGRARHDVGERAAAVDPELPAARGPHGCR